MQSGEIFEMPIKEIIRNARGSLTQIEFVEFLDGRHQTKTSQGLISKYESGKVNPPASFIEVCMKVIHGENISDEVSLDDLEERIRRILTGHAKAEARKAFAVILEQLS